jgi:hypothetical protein
MHDMKTASIRDLRHGFKKIERLLHRSEEIQITKRRRVIARLIPDSTEATKQPLTSWLGCAPSMAIKSWA